MFWWWTRTADLQWSPAGVLLSPLATLSAVLRTLREHWRWAAMDRVFQPAEHFGKAHRREFRARIVPMIKPPLSIGILTLAVLALRTVPVVAYVPDERWAVTSSGATGASGTPITLTWSFAPDGTSIPGEGASDLIAYLDGLFNVVAMGLTSRGGRGSHYLSSRLIAGASWAESPFFTNRGQRIGVAVIRRRTWSAG